jgi:acyl-CoA synthetase (AMP-forming)/AMP-acid ligase II
VPAEANIHAYASLADLLEAAFRRHAKRDALDCMDSRLSFGDLDRLSTAFGAWLQSLGLKPGDRVAVMMPNVPQYLVAIAAILRAGLVVVNVNPLYTARELQHQLNDSGAVALVVLENFAHTLEEVIDQCSVKHVVLAAMGELLGFWYGRWINFAVRHVAKMVPEFALPLDAGRTVTRFAAAVEAGSRLTLKRPEITGEHVAFLQYTGGTTGVSKGATLSHRNVVANIMQCEAWFKPMLDKVGDKPLTIVCALPLYHIFALTICALMGAHFGAMNVLIPNPRDIPGLVRTLGKHQINMFPAVNTLFNALANDACRRPRRWPPATGWTAGVHRHHRPACAQHGDRHPRRRWQRSAARQRRRDLHPRPAGDGRLLEPPRRDRQGHDGRRLLQERRRGHHGRARVYVRIVDRKKDMILVSGFNVYPNEIERARRAVPAKGSDSVGRRFAPTALRCSDPGGPGATRFVRCAHSRSNTPRGS